MYNDSLWGPNKRHVGFSFVCLRLRTDARGGEGGINFARFLTVTFSGLGDLLFKPLPKIAFLFTFALVVLLAVLLLAELLLLLHGTFLSDGITVQNDDRLQPPRKQAGDERCAKEADSPSCIGFLGIRLLSTSTTTTKREKPRRTCPKGK